MSSTKPRKNASPGDWHPADIKAALEKAGWTLRRLSLHHGNSPWVANKALYGPYPRAEHMIAEAIGVSATEIWPSRYDSKGLPKRGNFVPPQCTASEKRELA